MPRNPGDAPHLQDAMRPVENTDDFQQNVYRNAMLALMNLIDVVKSFNKRFKPPTNDLQSPALIPTSTDKWRTGYEMLVPITTTDHPGVWAGTGNPDTVISQIGIGQEEYVNFLTFKLSSAQKAMLVPKIRVYKLNYEVETAGTSKEVTLKRPLTLLEDPYGQQEIYFDAVATTSQVEEILGKPGKLTGTGIESFEWALKGVNPGEVDNNIEASLKIYFNNVSEIFRQRTLVTLPTTPQTTLFSEATFLDLITFAGAFITSGTGASQAQGNQLCPDKYYEGSFFEIRVDVGWQRPPEDTGGLFTPDECDYIARAQKSMFLQLTDHAFEFNEDGSGTLTANYRARYSLTDERYDLLGYNEDDDIKEHIKNNAKALEAQRDRTDDEDEELTATEKAMQTALNAKYRQIMQELLYYHVYETHVPEALLYISSNEPEEDLDFGGVAPELRTSATAWHTGGNSSIGDPAQINRFILSSPTGNYNRTFYNNVIKPLNEAYRNAAATLKVGGPWSYRRQGTDFNEKHSSDDMINVALEEEGSPVVFNPTAKDRWDEPSGTRTADDHIADHRERTHWGPRIQFFYLGDILEIFLQKKEIAEEVYKRELGFIAIDFEFANARKLLERYTSEPAGGPSHGWKSFSPRLVQLRCGFNHMDATEREQLISVANVCDIPIPVEQFIDFMKRKIIDELRTTYYLGDFIRDILNDFVRPIYEQSGVIGSSPNRPLSTVVSFQTDRNIPFFQSQAQNPSFGETVGYDQGVPPSATNVSSRGAFLEHHTNVDLHTEHPASAHSPAGYSGAGHQGNTVGQSGWQAPLSPAVHVGCTIGGDISAFVPPGPAGTRTTLLKKPGPDPADAATVKVISFQELFTAHSGDYQENLDKGIISFVVGLDRGLVKKVEFDRVDQPYLRESRVAKDRSAGLGQLRELYHVRLTLYGNTLLHPGMIIYVEPNILIFGKITAAMSPGRLLGLGGYHLVVDVENEIGKDGWETTIKALHVAMPAIDLFP